MSLGDIIAILDSNGNCVVEYTYDAWGKLLNTVDNSGINLGSINPLRYRGYYYDQETGLYYLQSRYYDPTVGRFINVEPNVFVGEYDYGSCLLGYNVFVFCANSPVLYRDDSGEAITLTILGISFGVKSIAAFLGLTATATFAIAYTSNSSFRNSWNSMVSSAITTFTKGISAIGPAMVSFSKQASSKINSIAKSIADSFANTRRNAKYRSPEELHHIVAKQAKNAKLARDILNDVGIKYYTDTCNLVLLKTGLHRRLHTDEYYGWANSVVISAYNSAKGNKVLQKRNVINALTHMKILLLKLNKIAPY